jgi:hypothetical protein
MTIDRCAMIAEILKQPLFLAIVGFAFTVGFAPWLARRWQDSQREREVRSGLVADMSKCIMSLVAVLERHHPGTRAAMATSRSAIVGSAREHGGESDTGTESDKELANAMLAFDIDRCIIGTKLETYFPDHSLAQRWTTFADELTLFCAGVPSDHFEYRLYRNSPGELVEERKRVAKAAARARGEWVEVRWGEGEQVFLAQKLALLASVRSDRMTQQRYPEKSIKYFMWSAISAISSCVALIGIEHSHRQRQPEGVWTFIGIGGVAAALAILLLLAGLLGRNRTPPEMYAREPNQTSAS